MAVLELEKDDLLALSDTELEQLIGRLSEAELVANGASVGDVRFSGSITASDGGVDVRVSVQKDLFTSDFIHRKNTIFQAKKHTMPTGAISSEMCPKGILLESIDKQARIGGGYIIASLADDCTENPMLTDRITAMKAAMGDHLNKEDIHLDFYDRFKLHQWLRQHPSIMLWVRNILGRPLSGWKPYERWSNVPAEDSDELITVAGVSIVLPSDQHQKLTIEQAIEPTRKLIRASHKAIRVTGLSGVGKTRFVQALFEESIGENALDRTSVIYADTGAAPIPSARQMIDQLIQDDRSVTIVIDNCPPALHSDLASKVSSSANHLKLITVEYDIRDDKPFTTDVVKIEAHGPEIAETLVRRRYPMLSQANTSKIAEFASGNTRVALALADCVDANESLANLTDTNLFDRLFQQRHVDDGRLREHAEILSLAYSFSVEPDEGTPDELAVLAGLSASTIDDLFRSTETLFERQIAQKRSQWRAILPQAIANRLASSGLGKIRIEKLRSVFENPANNRLLMSFAHRIGLLHEHPVALRIVSAWLAADGLLAPVTTLDEEKLRILDYVAPVCPELLLDRIEADLREADFSGFEDRFENRRKTIIRMLISLAYEPDLFQRCLNLLILIGQTEDESNNYDPVRNEIVQFFQPYLSGTYASLEQRAEAVQTNLVSADPIRRTMGLSMLSKALSGNRWTSNGLGDFGARPRDFGCQPNNQQLLEWRYLFIDLAVEHGLQDDIERSTAARNVLADSFHGLWGQAEVRQKLIDAATQLNNQRPWSEGWKSVQRTLYLDYRNLVDDTDAQLVIAQLEALRETLRPRDLISNIKAYLFGKSSDVWSLDPDSDVNDANEFETARSRIAAAVTEFGREFATSEASVEVLGEEIFSTNSMLYGGDFGRGLALGTADIRETWHHLVEGLRNYGEASFNYSILSGYLNQVAETNDNLNYQEILDSCIDDPLLRAVMVQLLHDKNFTEADLDRCMRVLDHPDVSGWSYGDFLWRQAYAHLPFEKLLNLAERLLEKPNGQNILLDALGIRFNRTDGADDALDIDLRKLGLVAAAIQLQQDQDGSDMTEYYMAEVLKYCLAHTGNDAEKSSWLDALFTSIDTSHGYGPGYEGAVKATVTMMPEEFLERVFQGDSNQLQCRRKYLKEKFTRNSLLGNAEINRIIAWSQSKQDPQVWTVIANGFKVFIPSDEAKRVRLEGACIQFLEASPNPLDVLNSFSGQIAPSGWSGSRADIMEDNTNALTPLLEHEVQEISDAARQVIGKARTWITAEREREKKEDEAREQSFE